jgi:hypothetical protein
LKDGWELLDEEGNKVGTNIYDERVKKYPLHALHISGNTYMVMDGANPFIDPNGYVMTYNVGKQRFNVSNLSV